MKSNQILWSKQQHTEWAEWNRLLPWKRPARCMDRLIII